MPVRLHLEGIPVDVTFKRIRNIYLRVHAPEGRVSLSVPLGMHEAEVRGFVLSRLAWIRKHREGLRSFSRETPCRYQDGEIHLLWGTPCLLRVREVAGPPSVRLEGEEILLALRPGAEMAVREALLESWRRRILREAVAPLLALWEERMGVKVNRLFLRRMKTRWGTCNYRACTIRLNTDLVSRPRICLEYVLVHELVHLLEPSHNTRFQSLMDGFFPGWREVKRELNRRAPG